MWQDFRRFLSDDMSLLRAARAKWTLVPSATVTTSAQVSRLSFARICVAPHCNISWHLYSSLPEVQPFYCKHQQILELRHFVQVLSASLEGSFKPLQYVLNAK